MLNVSKILAGPNAGRYYLDQIARGRDDYYAGEGEEPGRWVGSGAPLLEWGGEVDGDDFLGLPPVPACASRGSAASPAST